jgi:hypothetical protein
MPEFASLEPQDVRDYWTHEEQEFTPWLAEAIEAEDASDLENVLGLDLEVIQREKSVGKYKVDIFARAVDDGRNVVIENQLSDSDHNHLGKAIAYAAGLDADIIVWIAPSFNDEHTDAFQWLNTNSREGVDLFAVRLEIWRIADSPPAVRLNPVEEPSEWKEKAKRTEGELTETKQLQEEFWTEFRDRIKEARTPLRPRKPRPSHYYSNPIGKSGFHIAFSVDTREDKLHEDAFWELQSEAETIEQELGTDVVWEEPRETRSGKMRSNIRIVRNGDIENRDRWDEYFDWMLTSGEKFHDVFSGRLDQFD